jgi:hypothetical protein
VCISECGDKVFLHGEVRKEKCVSQHSKAPLFCCPSLCVHSLLLASSYAITSPHSRRLGGRSCLSLACSPQLHLRPSPITHTAQHFFHPPSVLCLTSASVCSPAACPSNTTPCPVWLLCRPWSVFTPTARQSGLRVDRPTLVYVSLCLSMSISLCHACRLSVCPCALHQSGRAGMQ